MFILARDLGMTVAELRRRISVREFIEWSGFYRWEHMEQEAARNSAKSSGRRR